MRFCIEIGDAVIELHHRYEYIKELCADYITDKKPEVSVFVTDEQIDEEIKLTDGRFPREMCEGTCLHRALTVALVKYGMILVHCAVVALDGEAYAFLAKSGVGKSTHISLWMSNFDGRAEVLNGDKPMFSFVGDRLYVHGTPWRGKEKWGIKKSLPVKAFCLLERGENNEIRPASEDEIVGKIFHQVLLPKNADDMAIFMGVLKRIFREIPFYILRCNMEKEAAIVAYEEMRKTQNES